ncbi:MAG TPA: hypothetical protein VN954_02415 [Ktedonobacteraceae bacterium]|nr:hypothetical protein [Ktedonobacteraceae bacterium]
MAKKSLITSSEVRSVTNTSTNDTSTKQMLYPPRMSQPSLLWLWIVSLLILGVIIFGGVSYIAFNWFKTIHITLGTGNTTQPPITTFDVGRTGTYAELSFTVLNAQYTTTFPNDTIQVGGALVRVNLQVKNKSTDRVSVIYYDVAHLLVRGKKPIAPTNVSLSTGPKPGASEIGWIDFPVSKGVQLSTLKLQLGSLSLNEAPLIIPFRGPYDPNHFAGKTYPQTLTIWYHFKGYTLVYHLTSVNVLYAYRGSQAAKGQQFYVLNFSVDNNNGVMVSPGFGFDYIRLIIYGYNTPPIDNSLPHDFKAGAQGVVGRVVYKGPEGLTRLSFAFLIQLVQGQNVYSVDLQ